MRPRTLVAASIFNGVVAAGAFALGEVGLGILLLATGIATLVLAFIFTQNKDQP